MADHIKDLLQLQAEYTVFYLKMRAYHWNVVGPNFYTLHEQFEKLYRFADQAIDKIAELIKARNGNPFIKYRDILENASLKEAESQLTDKAMVENTIQDLETIKQLLVKTLSVTEDDVSAHELLVDLIREHDGFLWMLRAFLAG